MSDKTTAKKRKNNNQPDCGNNSGFNYIYIVLAITMLTRFLKESFEVGSLQSILNFSPQEFQLFTIIASTFILSFPFVGMVLAIKNKKVSIFLWGVRGLLYGILSFLAFNLLVVIYYLIFLR